MNASVVTRWCFVFRRWSAVDVCCAGGVSEGKGAAFMERCSSLWRRARGPDELRVPHNATPCLSESLQRAAWCAPAGTRSGPRATRLDSRGCHMIPRAVRVRRTADRCGDCWALQKILTIPLVAFRRRTKDCLGLPPFSSAKGPPPPPPPAKMSEVPAAAPRARAARADPSDYIYALLLRKGADRRSHRSRALGVADIRGSARLMRRARRVSGPPLSRPTRRSPSRFRRWGANARVGSSPSAATEAAMAARRASCSGSATLRWTRR